MLRLKRLKLTGFRNYETLTWEPQSRITVISGPNGSGKTNLLEAVSLLSPGRGLRNARPAAMARWNGDGAWGVGAVLETASGMCDLGTGLEIKNGKDRRIFRLNGAAPKSQADIASQVAAIWLTPQMDRLFTESGSSRRRFLDRLVWAAEPGHAREIAAHDTAMAGRNRLLAEGNANGTWLAALEDSMARHAVAAAAARRQLAHRLNATLASGKLDPFPITRMDIADPIGDRLATDPAIAVEDWLRRELAQSRRRDASAGGAQIGAHRADMLLFDAITNQPAAAASTGQQKAMLIGLMLGHASLMEDIRGFAPFLLLDEPAVHLDRARRSALFTALIGLSAQIILTGTDGILFHEMADCTTGFIVEGGALISDQAFCVDCLKAHF